LGLDEDAAEIRTACIILTKDADLDEKEEAFTILEDVAVSLRLAGASSFATTIEFLISPEPSPVQIQSSLRSLSDPLLYVPKEHASFLVGELDKAAALIVELLEDAEITGSFEAMRRARKWLRDLGYLVRS